MELSLRMKQVADMVDSCHTAADIGCDHGYISIYLIEQGLAERVIAMDVRTGPLSRAEMNVKQKHLNEKIQCRLSDGLEKLQPGEVDTIVIAGMGGPLMIRILEQGSKKRLGNETLILQPQSDIPALRRYLHRIGYEILQEEMLWEDGKYYTVMKAKPGVDVQKQSLVNVQDGDICVVKSNWNQIEYQYGRYLLEQKSAILKQFLKQEATTLYQISEKLEMQGTEKAQERLLEIKEQLEWNQEAQKYYEAENHHELA